MFLTSIRLALFMSTISGCVYIPSESPSHNDDCHLTTHNYHLQSKPILSTNGDFSGCNSRECISVILGGIVVVSASSAILSGSVVIVGNSIHWIEHQGRCDSSFTQQSVNKFTNGLLSAGGWIVEEAQQLLSWLQDTSQDRDDDKTIAPVE